VPSDYEVVPVASFHPKLSERDKFYQYINDVGNSQDDVELNAHDNVMDLNDVPIAFMQGVLDDDPIALLSPAQMGVLLSFVPPAS